MNEAQMKLTAMAMMESARTNLQMTGRLPHVLIAVCNNTEAVVILDEIPPPNWPLVAQCLEIGTRDWNLIVHISEAWTRNQTARDPIRLPSECEDRGEGIMVELKNTDGDLICLLQPFDRDKEGGPIFREPAKWLEGDHAMSRVLRVSKCTKEGDAR